MIKKNLKIISRQGKPIEKINIMYQNNLVYILLSPDVKKEQ